jgi:hypothetical protein
VIIEVGTTPVRRILRKAEERPDHRALIAAIRRTNATLPSGWPIGLEQDLLRRGFGRLSLPVATFSDRYRSTILFADDPLPRNFGTRPPSELAAQLLWERAAHHALQPADLLEAAARLGGAPRLRTGGARTTAFASGHRLEYTAADCIPRRVEALLRRLFTASDQPLLHAIEIFVETLLIHPLPDGNGRLARLMFQLALRQSIGLRAPVFPLGPACAANRSALVSAYLALELKRDPEPLITFVATALNALVALYARSGTPRAPQA